MDDHKQQLRYALRRLAWDEVFSLAFCVKNLGEDAVNELLQVYLEKKNMRHEILVCPVEGVKL